MTEQQPIKPGDHVFLVDGSSFVFRAYFQSINQDAKYNYRSDGLPTGAVRLFCTKLYQFVREGAVGIRPTHLAIVFDKSEATFRKDVYADYKANRKEPPPDLVPQFRLMRKAVKAFGLIPVEKEGFEADDLIATYAQEAEAAGADVLIITSDKDLMQIVTPKIGFYDFESGAKGRPGYRPERRIDIDGVIDYFGVTPDLVTDVQALVGDTSDNVPGVPGIGIKTASMLIKEYGSLDNLLASLDTIKQPKRRESLIQYADQARMSKRLVTLDCKVETTVPLPDLQVAELDARRLLAFTKAMEFTTLTKRVAEATGTDANFVEPDPELRAGTGRYAQQASEDSSTVEGGDTEDAPVRFERGKVSRGTGAKTGEAANGAHTPQSLAEKVIAESRDTPCGREHYDTVRTVERLDQWIAAAREQGRVAIDTETTSLDAMQAEIVGISLAVQPGLACYIPIAHESGDADMFGGGLAPDQIPLNTVLERLKPLLESPAVLKVGQNIKYDLLVFARHGIDLSPADDTMLLSYALDSGRGTHGMDELAQRWLSHTCIAYRDVTGTGKARLGFARVPIEKAAEYSAEDADITLRLWRVLKARLAAEGMTGVYETLERPLVPVLMRMERNGIAIDRQMLSRLSGEFAQTMGGLEAEIFELAGESFNLGSPKQLGDILFGRMGLPGAKKTKTGAWATGANVLEELAEAGHDLPRRILDWRQLSKLKSTYTDSLQTYVHPETKRVHTSFSLASTSTGRLSSSEPNIQNIPIRTEAGRKIRKAFVAEPGRKLISADYSQIELRVLAHMADIPQLKDAFAKGHDIHAMTASEMFGVPIEGMPSDVRRRAKAINFGIIYGISAFGLANQLAIPRDEAGAYIKKYFERFPGIRDYMDRMKAEAKACGFVRTLFGRKCHYPLNEARSPAERGFLERAAINAPIQGTAADIIRRAMIRMEDALKAERLSARMLLQVHDELVFEVPDDEVEATLPVVRRVMENAPLPAVELAVPLQVDARAADNWDEAH
ncbi:DNA polymerase I [Terrihabitans rhizophilus]|uniref:DNA polymerase I n=1 Tax=Terrihabitans rhizophilus TaxID=3092662 RepID=A0ABU4RN24_9HYPH|nr:DNA polymerase I [Terrihabitans sp. PJ23]MDX6805065.1 DNA polymerase I [Terrihabitans sp. PJ23]